MKKISIINRLILYYVILSVLVLGVTGFIFYYIAKDAIDQRTFAQLTSLRDIKKKQIESFFSDRLNDMKYLLSSEILPEISDINSDAGNYGKLSPIFNYLNNSKYFSSLYIIGSKNEKYILHANRVFSSDSVSSFTLEEVSSHEYKVFPMEETSDSSKDNNAHLYISGMKDEVAKNKCYYLLEMKWDEINRIMLESDPQSGVGYSGETYLVGNEGLMKSVSRFHEGSINKTPVNTPGVDSVKNGKQGKGIFEDYRGIPVLSSFSPLDIPNLNWAIFAEIDVEEANKPVVEIRSIIIVITALIAGITFILTFLIARRISNPIIRLTKAVNSVAEGRKVGDLNIKTNDEIEILSDAFNDMSVSLQEKEEEVAREKINRLSAVLDTQEKERARLSKELHDGLGQLMIALKLELENADPSDSKLTASVISDVQDRIDKIIEEIRNISNDLMPSVLQEFGLVMAVRNLCHRLSEYLDIEFEIKTNINEEIVNNVKLKIYIFRIIQEIINNAVKHSQAKKITFEITTKNNLLFLSYKDDGIGFDTDGEFTGNGLKNISERVAMLGGKVELSSEPNKGTSYYIEAANK